MDFSPPWSSGKGTFWWLCNVNFVKVLLFLFIKRLLTCSRIYRSLTGGQSQLRHRVVVPVRLQCWRAGTTTLCRSWLYLLVRNLWILLLKYTRWQKWRLVPKETLVFWHPFANYLAVFFAILNSVGARNRVGIGLLYRPARLHRLAEFIP